MTDFQKEVGFLAVLLVFLFAFSYCVGTARIGEKAPNWLLTASR